MKQISIQTIFLTIIFFTCSCKEKESEPTPTNLTNPTNGKTTASFNPSISYGTMTDQDGNSYKTLTINNLIWMAENLRTTTFNDKTPIKQVIVDTRYDAKWINLNTSAYCNLNNTDNLDTIATYGRLYNGYAVQTGKLAPKGWHVATDIEWLALISYAGGETNAGPNLKEAGSSHWLKSDVWETNQTGFTAIPAGFCSGPITPFSNINGSAFLWSSTEIDLNNAWGFEMFYKENNVKRQKTPKSYGYSIRCVKDY